MAGPKSNQITYSFEGDTLDLQSAIKQVTKILNKSVKELKEYQDGTLTEGQKNQVKAVRNLIKKMKEAAKDEAKLTEDQKKQTIVTGKEALKQAQNLSKQAAKQKVDVEKKAAAEQERIEQLTTMATQEQAKQRAFFLEEYADRLKHVLSEEAYDEIKGAVDAYNLAVKDSSLSTEELADHTENLLDTFKNYSKTLQNALRAQYAAGKGITDIDSFFEEVQRQIKVTIKSFSFWSQVIRKVFQFVKQSISEYLNIVESIRLSRLVDPKQIQEVLGVAKTWRTLNEQIKLFAINVGSGFATILAPVIRMLGSFMVVVNGILSALTGVNKLAEATTGIKKISLTNIDEINQIETDGDNLTGLGEGVDNLIKGFDTLQMKVQPLMNLFESLREILAPVISLFNFSFDGFIEAINLIAIAIDTLISPIVWLFRQLQKLFNLIGPGIDIFKNFAGSLTAVVVIIPLMIKGFVGIAASIWKAIAAMVTWIATQIKNAAISITTTIRNWMVAGSYWKIAIAAIAAAGVGALVVAGTVMAATSTAESQANSSLQSTYGLPAMATGGVVNAPTLALVGEGDYSEVVMPLGNSPQFRDMKDDIAGRVVNMITQTGPNVSNNLGPSRPQTVVLEINGRELARAIMPDLANARPQTGVKIR